jgi:D-3-phosphoglycerate dehydrogenase / 2-oxoglutarate reductase
MQQLSLDKSKIRVLLLEGVHQNAIDIFNRNGYTNIETLRTALDENALIEKIKSVHLLGIRSRTEVTEKVLQAADKLIAIGCFCIGTNQVNLRAALAKGIPVFNAPLAPSPNWFWLKLFYCCVVFLKKMP